jgi:hypothetical protein
MLVRCFIPLFCLVAYFDVGPLFRPIVLFGCLFCCWSVVSSRCFVWLLILMLVRCFVPLFCLVAYFDVGPLFRPVVLFR